MGQLLKATAPTFTRPSNTTAYTALDLVANSTTAAEVTNREFVFERFRGLLLIRRVKLLKSDNDVANATFNVHLFTSAPTYGTNGDNDAVSGNTTAAGYIGTLLISSMYASVGAANGQGVPAVGPNNPIVFDPSFDHDDQRVTLYGVLQAAGAYSPASAETFTLTIEGEVAAP